MAAIVAIDHVQIGEPGPGWARAYIYDPFGNRLELIEPESV